MWILSSLSALVLLASIGVARRVYPESRTEAALLTFLFAVTLVHTGVHTLGWLGHLDARNLAASVIALCGAALYATHRSSRAGGRGLFEFLLRETRSFFALPIDALRECGRAKSSVTVLLLATLLLLVWTTWLSYLAPSGGWDGLWYHEPMVGFALQNHGFDIVPLPPGYTPHHINGYPRTSENLMLWFTIFSDRRLIDVVPDLMAAFSLLAFVALARNFVSWRIGALGFGCVMLTIPGTILQMRSTYADVSVLAAYLCALHFALRSQFGVREIWCSGLALAFLLGTKPSAIAYVVLIGGAALVRVFALARRSRSISVFGHATGALVVIGLLAAPSYVRNWLLHQNPIWPIRYVSRTLGLVLEGPHDIADMQSPPAQILRDLFGVPTHGQDYHDTRQHAYGYGVTFLGIPLFVIALVRCALLAMRAFETNGRRAMLPFVRLFAMVVLGSIPLVTSPSFVWARFALPSVGVALFLICVWLALDRATRFGEAAIAAMGFMNLVVLFWAEPGWDVSVQKAFELWRLPLEERVCANTSLNLMPTSTCLTREQRISAGDLVVHADDVGFTAILWNEAMSNRVQFLPFVSAASWLREIDQVSAKWIVVGPGTPEHAALRSAPDRFIEVGPSQRGDLVWERVVR